VSSLDEWYDKAGVRRDPRRVLDEELDSGKALFPRHLIPYLSHPLLDAVDGTTLAQLVARHTYQYFAFTAHFETRVVNRATEMLANGRLDTTVRPDTRLDAYKIYCDEAFHALYSFDVIQQLQTASGIHALPYHFDPFLGDLDAIPERVMPGRGSLPQLLQVVVFETLVTAILADVPKDKALVSLVRDTVQDHARDEGRHHAFFSDVFRELWTGLDRELRGEVAQCLPLLITRSLAPDTRPVRANLFAAGLTTAEVEQVMADVYRPEAFRDTVRQHARQSIRLFESVGVLDLPEGLDAFNGEGLL
jgi:hypothetical protein